MRGRESGGRSGSIGPACEELPGACDVVDEGGTDFFLKLRHVTGEQEERDESEREGQLTESRHVEGRSEVILDEDGGGLDGSVEG